MKIYLRDIDPDQYYSDHLKGSEILRASTWDPIKQPDACIDHYLFTTFEKVREMAGGTPVTLNSAFRNFIPLGGSKKSAHLRGLAFDIGLTKKQLSNFRTALVDYFLSDWTEGDFPCAGLGVYTWGVHVDVDYHLGFSDWQVKDRPDIWVGIRHWGDLILERSTKKKEDGAQKHSHNYTPERQELILDVVKKNAFLIFLPLSVAAFWFFFMREKQKN
jgi:hypothetical protein